MLDKQVNIYSVDTGNFYSNNERYLHNMNCKYRQERNYLKNQINDIQKKLIEFGIDECCFNSIKKGKFDDFEYDKYNHDIQNVINQYYKINKLIEHKRHKANESKQKMLELLKHKVNQNIYTNGKDHIRELNPDTLNDNNIISIFDSDITRVLGIKQDTLSDDLIVVQVYYFDVFKDMLLHGFIYKGERYIYYTSSAGQIRKKKAVFINEKQWLKNQKTLMCGLTIDMINAKGGNNINKFLAYTALTSSSTDLWNDFDIDKCIVVDDFETNVEGEFDYINDVTYEIKRITNTVPIPHMDGAGIMLPSVSKKNFMIRMPFVKGLLCVFDFVELIKEKNWNPIVKDIYGIEHDVISEGITIILTKSQFKLYKFYDSWEQYKSFFKKYNCSAGICKIEEDVIPDATINYQMLQSLTDITDDEIDAIVNKSVERVKNVCNSIDTMKNILGATAYNTNMTSFQKSVSIYPALLKDTYSKDVLRDVKNSLVKKYRSGKLEIKSKYTFILPDVYAFCEWLFGKIENPNGLLNDKEVYCRLFKKYPKLDCLRSPHLYKEHAIRINTACKENADDERLNELNKWYTTDGLYASTKDLISRVLQYDRP